MRDSLRRAGILFLLLPKGGVRAAVPSSPDAAFQQSLTQARAAFLSAAAGIKPLVPDVLTAEQALVLVKKKLAGSGVPDSYADQVFADPRVQIIDEIPGRFGVGRPVSDTTAPPMPYEQYRKYVITEPNVLNGALIVCRRRELLDAVSARYGVDGALLVALTGVETLYGTVVGNYPVFGALYTIARKVPARSDWAAGEVAALLQMTWTQKLDPHALLGSYAGAFGYVQFEPSSYNRFAVDFDGNGRARLDEWPDALASAANYLLANGYKASDPFTPESTIGRSLFAYNHSENYVRVILELRQEILRR